MSSRAAVALVLTIALVVCVAFAAMTRGPSRRDEALHGAAQETSATTTVSLPGSARSSTSTAITARAMAPPSMSDDDLERDLERAAIEAIKPRGEPEEGLFDATITRPGRSSREPAELSIALIEDPYAYRRPLAFYRLAKALGASVVPVSVARRVSAGELAARITEDPSLAAFLPFLQAHASIQNDGTVDAILRAPEATVTPGAPGGPSVLRRLGRDARELAVNGAPEMEMWASWALSSSPAPAERTTLLCGYVEMLVLDYLAANSLRRSATLDDASGSLWLVDNASAFPRSWDAQAETLLLARLRDVRRFPKGLRDKLARFDRTAAAAALAPGGFDTWLVSPRTLVTLDERRASVLTLIEARIAESSEAATLSL